MAARYAVYREQLGWSEARHSLTFAYERWGLYGVAEYVKVP